jgi:hypothetical protein
MVHAIKSAKNFREGTHVKEAWNGQTGTIVGKWGGYSCCSHYERNWYYIVKWDVKTKDDWPVGLVNEDDLEYARRG